MGLNGARREVAPGGELEHGIGEFLAGVCECDSIELGPLRRLGGGAVQENYALDAIVTGGRHHGCLELVLRADANADLSTSITRSQEFEVLRAAWQARLTVPEPLWVCADESVIGREFYLMRRLPGRAAGHLLVRDAALEGARERIAERLGQELARLHRVRPPHPELEFLPEPDLPVALWRVYQYQGYLDRLHEPQPTLEWGLRWLERHASQEEGELVLCHGDFRTGNYLVDDGELAGILDWEFAGWGDRLEDLGWFCARCWRFGAWEHEAGGLASRDALYRGYERESGLAIDRERVEYWEVMASVRWAILALQQGERHLSGRERSLELALTARMVPEMELDVLMQLDALAEVPAHAQ